MPTINVKKDLLMHKLGENYTDEQFDELCFQFGIELDEVTSERKMALKEKGVSGQESDDVIYKIDLPANRYDLVSLEGLVLALKIFTSKIKPPDFKVRPSGIKFFVDLNAHNVRHVLLGAVVRHVEFDQDLYNSFIDLQDKIHQNIGRKRSIVSIGTHDLDTIQGPFLYTAIEPEKLRFVPLNQEKEYNAKELMELYKDSHLKSYLPIIKDKPKYPCILDSNKNVLSMPPIINGNKSKITLDTKNVLIEITATDIEKATIALDTIVTMLASANGTFEVESVEIEHEFTKNSKLTSPNLEYYPNVIEKRYINSGLGTKLSAKEIANLLGRMGLRAEARANGHEIDISIPPTRHDIISKCDVMEDVGIAFGYDNIKKTLPGRATIASQVFLNKVSDQIRNEVARCGYTEALNFSLCSEDEMFKFMGRSKKDVLPVKLMNPKTSEFEIGRVYILPGLLKTLNSNKKMPLPMKLFEVGDIMSRTEDQHQLPENKLQLAAVYYGKQTSGFEIIHGLLDRVMQVLECPYIGDKEDKASEKKGYYIRASSDGAYLPGRCAAIVANRVEVGSLGIINPSVLENFELNHPASALELDLERFVRTLGLTDQS